MAEASTPTTAELPPAPTVVPLTEQGLTGLAGWANLRRAVNVTFPAQLAQAERLVMNVLRGA